MTLRVREKSENVSTALQFSPMLCTLANDPIDDDSWIYEPKFDGLRVLAVCTKGKVELVSRNQKSQTFQFPDVIEALGESLKHDTVVDGEIVCLDESGLSSFRALQQRFNLTSAQEVQRRMADHPAYLYLFDILRLDGRDLTARPLEERKKLLRESVKWTDRIRWTEGTPREGSRLLKDACARQAEGIVGKRLGSLYTGGRTGEWIKVKCSGRQEFVIGGFTEPQGSRVGLGALLVGYFDESGNLKYAGKVGTGFGYDTLQTLREKLDTLEARQNPFADAATPRAGKVHWVKPSLVAEIAFAEWTQNDLLRQPRFEGLRMDKKATAVKREKAVSASAIQKKVKRASKSPADKPAPKAASEKPLGEYLRKRDLKKSPEPAAKVEKSAAALRFVIQQHAATRLHWDFRLESQGVLKSWAVTNEPTMDPAIKRLAIRVEDHPLAYRTFEGDIPEGSYGAGHVDIWDEGTYQPKGDISAGLDAGKIEFELHGKKLQGMFAMVRMRRPGSKEQWLLIKMKDAFAESGSAKGPAPRKTGSRATSRRAKTPKAEATVESAGKSERVAFTHTDKMMFPDAKMAKGDVLAYYEAVAEHLLPFLKDRPVTLERLPDGLARADAPRFWQKNTPSYYPEWIPRVELPAETGKPVQYAIVNDVNTLLYLVNQGTITFHPFLSRVGSLDRPDIVLFDLDPGEASFASVVRVARELHGILENDKINALLKTSGKSGLHILTQWKQQGGYDEARAWASEIAERLVKALPKIATTERSKAGREGRVYVDVIQNARGHHVVPPYVLRAVPEATVSTPLDWNELTAKLNPKKFTAKYFLKNRLDKRWSFDPAGD